MDEDALLGGSITQEVATDKKFEFNKGLKAMSSWLERLKLITVEPVMFLYMLAFMITSVVEQAFFVHKACKVNLGFTDEVCNNLTRYREHHKQVQIVVSTFHQFNDIASHVIPIFLALFIGAWSDRRGRKLLLLLGLMGKLWYSLWIVINSVQDKWNLNVVLWTASLPSGLTGADLSIFAAAFAYLSDVTTPENRTKRITVLDVTYLASMPIGVSLGKYLFSYFDRSYTAMFALNSSLLFVALIFAYFKLEWATSLHQKPLNPCCFDVKNKLKDSMEREGEGGKTRVSCFLDFFDRTHLIESVKAIGKRRPENGRSHLIILILAMGLYTFQRDEKQMIYLYTNLIFEWNVNSFSDFRIFQSGIYVVGTLLCIPLMGKRFKLSDTTMILIGTSGHWIARFVLAFAKNSRLFYLGAAFAGVGPVVPSVLRSMASKIVSVHERGKIFAVLSVADTTVPLFSGVIYSQVYNSTIHTYPSAIFYVTIATQLMVSMFALIIRCTKRENLLEFHEETSGS